MKLNKKQQILNQKKNEYYEKNDDKNNDKNNPHEDISYDTLRIETDNDIKESYFNDFLQDIKFELLNYVKNEALPLCEDLDYINFYNYMKSLIDNKFI